jgi:hypothetical protein
VKRRRIVKFVVIGIIVAGLSQRTFAFLGFFDIVFDPDVYAEAVQQLIQMERQYTQLVQTYQMARNQYQQLLWMAQRVPVDMAARYRAVATSWRASSATNTYGTTSGWVAGINTGTGVASGYARATQPLDTYGAAMASVPAEQLQRVKTDYATVELTDGANVSTMDTIGRLRANAPAVEQTIQALEADSLSSDPSMNTEVAVLNKINAAEVIALRSAQDTNKLLVALAEQRVTEAKRTRDAEARAINNHIRFMAEGKAVLAAQAAGASDAMLAWRMR